MQLISEKFVLFFIIAMIVFLSSFRHKRVALLLFNVVFYLYAGISGAILFGLFSIFTYFAARFLEKNKNKWIFAIILVISFCPLLFYKYSNFVMSDIFGLELAMLNTLSVPLGISFFTFQGVGYLIDVYKDKCGAEKNFMNYFVFLSLFTCISSGPINRSEGLLTQIREFDSKTFDYQRCVRGGRFILVGLFMKVFVASCLSMVAAKTDSGLALFVASICYTIEIYCDFCGYSYIAFGLSEIMGLSVIQNFNKPYSSKSISEFWRRWHISLSSWLKDYVYISLGGSRCSKVRAYFNQIVTFFVSGIWHGANWTFIVWGLLNGVIISLEKLTGFTKKSASKAVNFVKHIITLIVVNTLWIFFDAPTIGGAVNTIKTICVKTLPELLSIRSLGAVLKFIPSLGVTTAEFLQVVAALIGFGVFVLAVRKKEEPVQFFESKYAAVRWAKYLVVFFVILVAGMTGEAGAFIYANF